MTLRPRLRAIPKCNFLATASKVDEQFAVASFALSPLPFQGQKLGDEREPPRKRFVAACRVAAKPSRRRPMRIPRPARRGSLLLPRPLEPRRPVRRRLVENVLTGRLFG